LYVVNLYANDFFDFFSYPQVAQAGDRIYYFGTLFMCFAHLFIFLALFELGFSILYASSGTEIALRGMTRWVAIAAVVILGALEVAHFGIAQSFYSDYYGADGRGIYRTSPAGARAKVLQARRVYMAFSVLLFVISIVISAFAILVMMQVGKDPRVNKVSFASPRRKRTNERYFVLTDRFIARRPVRRLWNPLALEKYLDPGTICLVHELDSLFRQQLPRLDRGRRPPHQHVDNLCPARHPLRDWQEEGVGRSLDDRSPCASAANAAIYAVSAAAAGIHIRSKPAAGAAAAVLPGTASGTERERYDPSERCPLRGTAAGATTTASRTATVLPRRSCTLARCRFRNEIVFVLVTFRLDYDSDGNWP
jgi:hypothetical protein